MSIHPVYKYWSDGQSNPIADPNPRLQMLVEAARRGAQVRVLLDSFFDDPDALRSNRATVDYLNPIQIEGPSMNLPQGMPPAIELPLTLKRTIRLVIGGLYGVIAILFVAALIVGHSQLQQVCYSGFCHPMQLSPTEATFNEQLGLSRGFYATYTTVTYLVFGGVGLVVGALIP